MIERAHELSLVRQAERSICRGHRCTTSPCPVSQEDLALMRRIDELHLEFPFAGSRLLRDLLNDQGANVNRKRIGA
jgi:putative transposase